MNERSRSHRVAESIRNLSPIAWCLVAVCAAAWLVLMLAPDLSPGHSAPSPQDPAVSLESRKAPSFEDKVKRASVILLTEFRPEGGKLRAIVTEELRHAPNTTIRYGVGSEYLPLSVVPREDAYYGEGLLVLFEGSPAVNREVYSIFNGRVAAGDMPLSEVRRIIAGGP